MEVSGKVKAIFDKQTFNSGFTKQEVIVTTQEQYPQHLSIEFLQDKVSLIDSIQVGDDVKISINLRGREWTSPEGVTKYFNSITGWRIEKITSTAADANDYNNLPPTPPVNDNSYQETAADSQDDDLPF